LATGNMTAQPESMPAGHFRWWWQVGCLVGAAGFEPATPRL
jgi:hypothetical protein